MPSPSYAPSKSDDFFGTPPSWIVRWGTTLFACVFALCMLMAYFISYPDAVEKDVIITAMQSPQRVKATLAGEYRMLAREQQKVQAGELLGYVETATRIEDVWILEKKLKNAYTDTLFLPDFSLGELQGSYEIFRLAHLSYKQNKTSSVYVQIEGIEEQVINGSKMATSLVNQERLVLKEYEIQLKAYNRDKTLFEKQVISAVDMERSEQAYIAAKKNMENIRNQMLQQEAVTREKQNRVEELRLANKEKDIKVLGDLQSACQRLKSEIETYKRKYCLIAFQAGKVNYLAKTPVHNKLYVPEGQEILAVVADEKSSLVGTVLIDVEFSGKVSKGQTVQVRLLNYPYEEFGMLVGKVERITNIPLHVQDDKEKGKYRVEISIANLTTDQNKQIPFAGELEGRAKIITKEYSILDRIFLKIWKAKG